MVTKKPRVVISGYYGFANLGDEAVLYSMLEALRQEIPGLEATVLSNNPAATTRDYGVPAVNRWRLQDVAGAIRGSQLLISGGGSLLQDVTGLPSLLYYLGVIRLARFLGRPAIYYAQGIGPLQTGAGRRLTAMITRRARAVTVRDEESRQDLLSLGLKQPVEVTADPVLGLHPDAIDPALGTQILRGCGVGAAAGAPVVGVAVRRIPGLTGWEQELAGALDLLARSGCQVVFVPMQNPADLTMSQEIARLMGEQHSIVEQNLTVPQMLSLMANLDVMVGLRLHALIMAAVCAVPPVGIVYDPKVERFLKRLDIAPAGDAAALEATALAAQTQEFLHNSARIQSQMLPRLEQLRRKARRSAQLVGELLG